MKRLAVVALTAMGITGFAFGTQDQPAWLQLAGSAGTPIRFMVQTNSRNVGLRAAELYTNEPGSLEALTPATISYPPTVPFDIVLTAVASADTLQLTHNVGGCEVTRAGAFNLNTRGLANDTSYIQDADITCSGGALMLSAKRVVLRHSNQPSAVRSLLRGHRITLARATEGAPITIRAELMILEEAGR